MNTNDNTKKIDELSLLEATYRANGKPDKATKVETIIEILIEGYAMAEAEEDTIRKLVMQLQTSNLANHLIKSL